MKIQEALARTDEIPFLMHFQEEDPDPLTIEGEYSPELRMWISRGDGPVAAGTKRQGTTQKPTQGGKDRSAETDTFAD